MKNEWRLDSSLDCACCDGVESKIKLLYNRVSEKMLLRSILGCYGGEEMEFNPREELFKVKEFIKVYLSEGLLKENVEDEVVEAVSQIAIA